MLPLSLIYRGGPGVVRADDGARRVLAHACGEYGVGGVGFAGRRGPGFRTAWAGQAQGVGYPEAVRKWVVLLIAAVVVIAVVAVVLTQQSQQQARAEQVDQWHQDLHAWEESQAEALAAPEGPRSDERREGKEGGAR